MPPQIEVGEVVHGTLGRRWIVGDKIGQGTCCTCYEVTLEGEDKFWAALKIFKEGKNFAGAHERESQYLECVHKEKKCKHIVSVIDEFDHKDHPCLIEELLDCDIRQIIFKNREKGLSLHNIQKLTWQMMIGLERIHRCGFVHGDIKPSNLMWDSDEGVLKIIDFSLSFHIQDTNVGLLQSSGYRAPETEHWNNSVDPDHKLNTDKSLPPVSVIDICHLHSAPNRDDEGNIVRPNKACDMWSVGCVLLEMFTGEKMFTKHKMREIIALKSKISPASHGMMTLWLSQVLKPRANDECETNSSDLIVEFNKLVKSLLWFDPVTRITSESCLKHSFFNIQTVVHPADLLLLCTRVLRLDNLINDDDITDPQLQKDIEDLIKDECDSQISINQIQIPSTGKGRGKIFVEFSDAKSSRTAYSSLHKRILNGRPVLITYYPLEFLHDNQLA